MNGPCVRLTEGADVSRTVAVCIIMPSATLVEAESAKPSTCGGLTRYFPCRRPLSAHLRSPSNAELADAIGLAHHRPGAFPRAVKIAEAGSSLVGSGAALFVVRQGRRRQ